jgi:hypothetical protein
VARPAKKTADVRKRVLRDAEDIAVDSEDGAPDDIARTGVVWSGLLDADSIIPSHTVAAMLAAYELVKATSHVDSEQHWTGAAAYAATGAYCDLQAKDDENTESESKGPIGFVTTDEESK